MNKEYTEIVCIIDRSGSMGAIKDDAIGGFNTFLEEQKKESGIATLTYIQFNNQYEIVHENKLLQEVPLIDEKTYIPRGMTALLDAIGKTIEDVGKRLSRMSEENRPKKVIVNILTDGMENASTQFSLSQIKEMIRHQKEKYQWEFIFTAANQDAFAEGYKLGVDAKDIMNFDPTGEGIKEAYRGFSISTTTYRTK